MLKGLHPIKKNSYLLDKNINIHITKTSILTKYITYDHLKSNDNIIKNYILNDPYLINSSEKNEKESTK